MTVKAQDATVEKLVSVKELSEMTGVPTSTIYDLMVKDELPFVHLGRRKWVRLLDWAEMVADNYESRHDI